MARSEGLARRARRVTTYRRWIDLEPSAQSSDHFVGSGTGQQLLYLWPKKACLYLSSMFRMERPSGNRSD
jgi:hypothetical protein